MGICTYIMRKKMVGLHRTTNKQGIMLPEGVKYTCTSGTSRDMHQLHDFVPEQKDICDWSGRKKK